MFKIGTEVINIILTIVTGQLFKINSKLTALEASHLEFINVHRLNDMQERQPSTKYLTMLGILNFIFSCETIQFRDNFLIYFNKYQTINNRKKVCKGILPILTASL